MAYNFYLDGVLLPVTPGKLQLKINNANKKITLINEGEVNLLKSPSLTDIEFDALLPNQNYPFAVYLNGYQPSVDYTEKLKELKKSKKSFQFKVTRTTPNGKMLFDNDITVSLESYTLKEDAKNYGMDILASIKLKEYKDFETEVVKIKKDKKVTKKKKQRNSDGSPKKNKSQTYTVKEGDSLWGIAKAHYGDGSKYTKIFNANKDKIDDPNSIHPGQKLTIPAQGVYE